MADMAHTSDTQPVVDSPSRVDALPPREPLIHPLFVRITHWINALAFLLMIGSGWLVPHPAWPREQDGEVAVVAWPSQGWPGHRHRAVSLAQAKLMVEDVAPLPWQMPEVGPVRRAHEHRVTGAPHQHDPKPPESVWARKRASRTLTESEHANGHVATGRLNQPGPRLRW